MSLRVVGAGIGRTGTHSLKLALERLLGAPCYHMLEVLSHWDYARYWRDAIDGKPMDWDAVMHGYAAAVDWPAAAFWRELADAYPGAIVLLSTRSSAEAWWKSASETIFDINRQLPADPALADFVAFPRALLTTKFTPNWTDEREAKRAYERHNATVRESVASDRLVDWQPGDGWGPICSALDLPIPDEPFPHMNTTNDFRLMVGLDS
jgi:sulfotransferase family protein